MKILLSWLSDYVETGKLSAEQIAEILSDVGLPCEGIEYLGDDAVIDVEVTSNRGDCLSFMGIARELAAATGRDLTMPEVKLDESDKDVTEFAGIEILEPALCGRYTARVIEQVKVGPSPHWLKNRLEAVGLRSVNNVVDATNYAMLETGQPPHAFDYDRIAQGRIIVRKAEVLERLVSIDGTKCDLDTDMLIITDPRGPVAVAGVMGGLDTEVSDETLTILLEDAYFDPVSIRRTSRRLGLASEAAFRFERTVDIEMIDWASKRTAQLITELAGGRVVRGVVDIYPKRKPAKEVILRLSRLDKLLGIEVPHKEAVRILAAMSFQPDLKGDLIICLVPSWRSDVCREVDLIEEVARLYGYNKIATSRKIEIEAVPVDPHQKLAESLRAHLNACGFYETINVGFVDSSVAELFTPGGARNYMSVRDDSRKSMNLLRQTLLGSLLDVVETNVNAGNLPCKIYEIADTFLPTGKKCSLPIEEAKLAMVCDGDFRELRGAIEGLVKSMDRGAQIEFRPAELVWAEAGAEIVVDGKTIGTAGNFSQAVKRKFDLTDLAPVGAELHFAQLAALKSGPVKVRPFPRFPAIERDLSIIVDEQVCWDDIVRTVRHKAPAELQGIRFVDIYRGKGIPPGKKSVTLSVCFRDEQGTLTHETVDGFQGSIVQRLAEALGAELRTV
jgi:phenylalanyl-tRNA synthetase beta chain